MYVSLKGAVLSLLKVPPEPEDPMGDVEKLRVFRASPNYFRYKLIAWGIRHAFGLAVMLAILIALLVSLGPTGAILDIIGLVIYLAAVAFSYVTLRLDYEMRWYKVTDRSLRIREGVWFVREMTMTFANIQNISIEQGPVQRFFEIADLRVRSAGGGDMGGQEGNAQGVLFNAHVGFFRGVDNAEEIRDLVLDRLRRLRDAGLGDTDESETTEPSTPAAAAAASPPEWRQGLQELATEARALRLAAERLP